MTRLILLAVVILSTSYLSVAAIVFCLCHMLGRDFNFLVATLIWIAWYALNMIRSRRRRKKHEGETG